MTNCDSKMEVQPIRYVDKDTKTTQYFFEDKDILREMEKYHIQKESSISKDELATEIDKRKKENKNVDNLINIKSSKISELKVTSTFSTCTGAGGPDNIKGNLIDNADRKQMIECLEILWNKAWDEGVFLDSWKEEHRAALPELSKEDFHNCDSYRTISLTAVLGKRFEKISSKRLVACLEDDDIDFDQFAYLEGRYGTQAVLTLVETVKRAKKQGKKVGVVFFDFTDAFGNVDRLRLLDVNKG